MIAYFINPAEATVTQIELADWAAIRTQIGGYLEAAVRWGNGDVLYVDEEGFLKPQSLYFRLADRPDQPLAGVGVMVGRESDDEDSEENRPPTMALEQLRDRVTFVSRAVVVALLRARPSMTVTDPNSGETDVLGSWDELLRSSKLESDLS